MVYTGLTIAFALIKEFDRGVFELLWGCLHTAIDGASLSVLDRLLCRPQLEWESEPDALPLDLIQFR